MLSFERLSLLVHSLEEFVSDENNQLTPHQSTTPASSSTHRFHSSQSIFEEYSSKRQHVSY